MRLLILMMGFLFGSIGAAEANDHGAAQTVWMGWGMSQTENFWADRAPITPKWHLNWERQTPWALGDGSAWESPVRSLLGVNGFWAWENGTQDFGEEQSVFNGEIGVALGPSLQGSIFRLGCEMIALAQVGMSSTVLRALEQSQTETQWNAAFGVGPGWHAGWGAFALRQQTLLGYGVTGFHHEVRLALGVEF
jgi:hypothetical protein